MNVLADTTQIGAVTLAVADIDRSLTFYRDLAGLREITRDATHATIGAGGVPLMHLEQERGAMRPPRRASGLYHTAILYPDRATLAGVVTHIADRRYPFTGASDHLVSEAFYLDDPDGLGVELYRDRPRNEWKWDGNRIEMASLPLDVPELLSAAGRPFSEAPPGTRIGHVHLKVSDIAEAERFYVGEVGFGVKAHFGDSATFLAAGSYHHHLGANIWESRGAAPVPAGHARLRALEILGAGAARELTDPWGHSISLRA